jgi:DNA-binding NarL/FixJ family response regulator
LRLLALWRWMMLVLVVAVTTMVVLLAWPRWAALLVPGVVSCPRWEMSEDLTARQWEIAALVAEGLTNAEIVERLVITEGTVANMLGFIRRRLGLRNRVQVAVWAVKQGLYWLSPRRTARLRHLTYGRPRRLPRSRSLIMACVLVVDDAAQIRRMVRFTVEDRGHRVLEAEDGIAGWQMMRMEQPDVVIMDVMMPGPSGLEVCRTIRADPRHAAVPIIILTAGNQTSKADALAAGASGYMTKPFSPAALLDMVTSLTGS